MIWLNDIKCKCKNCGEEFIVKHSLPCLDPVGSVDLNKCNAAEPPFNCTKCFNFFNKKHFYIPSCKYSLCDKCKEKILPKLKEPESVKIKIYPWEDNKFYLYAEKVYEQEQIDYLKKLETLYEEKREQLKRFEFTEKDETERIPHIDNYESDKIIRRNKMKLKNYDEDEYEEIREECKPKNVEMLFVGESRPKSGDFFYYENTDLYRYTKKAFENAGVKFSLDKFKELNCWLYDVCDKPVNHLSKAQRRDCIKKGIPKLVETIDDLKPHYIIVVKKGDMKKIVYSKICEIGFFDGETVFNTPFPGCSHQNGYVEQLTEILKGVLK